MYLILGIGNPGKNYDGTRHNTGFMTIDRIIEKENISEKFKSKFNGEYIKTKISGEDVILLKPQTYVNNSGDSLIKYISYFKIKPQNVIVIYDDIDTKPGNIRIRKSGSSGGHNGIKSILNHLKDFVRLRVGIGREEFKGERISFVLSKPRGKELEDINLGIEKAADAAIDILSIGTDKTMNKYNKKEEKKKKNKEGENNDINNRT